MRLVALEQAPVALGPADVRFDRAAALAAVRGHDVGFGTRAASIRVSRLRTIPCVANGALTASEQPLGQPAPRQLLTEPPEGVVVERRLVQRHAESGGTTAGRGRRLGRRVAEPISGLEQERRQQ
jgi:hypothetical protein